METKINRGQDRSWSLVKIFRNQLEGEEVKLTSLKGRLGELKNKNFAELKVHFNLQTSLIIQECWVVISLMTQSNFPRLLITLWVIISILTLRYLLRRHVCVSFIRKLVSTAAVDLCHTCTRGHRKDLRLISKTPIPVT